MQHQLSCEQVIALLTFYTEDKLSKKLAQYVQEHLEICPECMEKYKHLKQILNKYLEFKIKEYLKSNFSLNMPVIQIKKLKARWGACFTNQNKVCFNLVLVHLEKELIDYLIVHELCHFIQPNHSKLFYQEVQKRLPDYKEREKKLKEIGI